MASRSDLSEPQVDALYEYIGLPDRVHGSEDEPGKFYIACNVTG